MGTSYQGRVKLEILLLLIKRKVKIVIIPLCSNGSAIADISGIIDSKVKVRSICKALKNF
jgi:hypothetical protein